MVFLIYYQIFYRQFCCLKIKTSLLLSNLYTSCFFPLPECIGWSLQSCAQQNQWGHFPGGSVVENPLPKQETDPGRSHTLWSNQASVPQLASLCSRAEDPNHWARMPRLLKHALPSARAPQLETPVQWEARAPQPEWSLLATATEKLAQQRRPSAAPNK